MLALALGMTATTMVLSQTPTVKTLESEEDHSPNKTLTEAPDKTEVEKKPGLLTAANDAKHDAVVQHTQPQAQRIPKNSTEAFEPFYAGGAATLTSNVSANAHEAPPNLTQNLKQQLNNIETKSHATSSQQLEPVNGIVYTTRRQQAVASAAPQQAPAQRSSALMQLPSQKFYPLNPQFPVDFFINRYVLIISVILYTGAAYSGALLMHILMWKGHFEHAARIAERRLKRRPHDAKLCATLANIYLALNRHDERANEIYRKALRFDPATDNRSKITSLIVQYCKHEEEMDSEVWKVCGGALSA
ncbi:hypothetical protein EDS67_23700 [candidate division KSB1 bacterium]|nr:MAG: hypothetical protein EDS67_23700 [candidate division KSB1 bacterium]